MAKYPSEEQDRFIVRLPDGMRDRLKAVAAENNRSMNQEIVERLESSFEPFSFLPKSLLERVERAAVRSGKTVQRKIQESLQEHYPLPLSVDDVANELRALTAIIRPGANREVISLLLEELSSLASKIADGKLEMDDPDATARVRRLLLQYEADPESFIRKLPPDPKVEATIGEVDESEQGQDLIRQLDAHETAKNTTPGPIGSTSPLPTAGDVQDRQGEVFGLEKLSSASGKQHARKLRGPAVAKVPK